MVRPGATIHADPAKREFHDAKYAVCQATATTGAAIA
jgi:hypothetical protein